MAQKRFSRARSRMQPAHSRDFYQELASALTAYLADNLARAALPGDASVTTRIVELGPPHLDRYFVAAVPERVIDQTREVVAPRGGVEVTHAPEVRLQIRVGRHVGGGIIGRREIVAIDGVSTPQRHRGNARRVGAKDLEGTAADLVGHDLARLTLLVLSRGEEWRPSLPRLP